MRPVALVIFLLLINHCAGATERNPFLKLKYDSVVIYDYEVPDEGNAEIIVVARLNGVMHRSATLSIIQANELGNWLGSKKSYGGVDGTCFLPHLGIVYYSQGRAVAWVSVCLTCNQLRSSLFIAAQHQGWRKTGSEEAYSGMGMGMSAAFRKYLFVLLRQNHFSLGG